MELDARLRVQLARERREQDGIREREVVAEVPITGELTLRPGHSWPASQRILDPRAQYGGRGGTGLPGDHLSVLHDHEGG